MPSAALRYLELAPPPDLARFVRAFFFFAGAGALPPPRRALRDESFPSLEAVSPALFADAGASLVISLGASWRVAGLPATAGTGPTALILGPMSAGRRTQLDARVDAVGAYFHPGGLRRFARLPLAALANTAEAAADVLGQPFASLACELAEASPGDARLTRLVARLRRFAPATPAPPDARVARAVAALAGPGAPPIAALARELGVSRQHLRRGFLAEIGLSPKRFARIARVRRLLGERAGETRRGGAELAARHGFADQSHLIAELRALTGLRPSACLASARFHPFAG